MLPGLGALATFEAAARHEAFTQAAEELGMTQSAVSKQIAQLEKFLGTRLFERVRRRVVLTEAGAIYASEIRDALNQAEAATLAMLTAKTGDVLHIAALVTLASHWLSRRMVSFASSHPDVAFNLTTYNNRPFNMIAENIDVAIYYGEPSWPGAIADFLMWELLFPVCTPQFAAANNLRTIEDLRNVTLLQQTTRPDAWLDWLTAAGLSDMNALRGPRFEHYSMIIEASLAGMGIGVVPQFVVADHVAAGRLITPFDVVVKSRFAYYLVYPEQKRHLPKVLAFRRWMLRTVRQAGLPK